MKLLLIQPSVGKIHGEKYVKSWTMEPGFVHSCRYDSDDIDIELIDERIDELPEIYEADLVGLLLKHTRQKSLYYCKNSKNRR